MNTLHKYPIRSKSQVLAMPTGAKALHVGSDPEGVLCLWAQVETDKAMEERHVYVTGTGFPITFNAHYVGTVLDGRYVWHIFID